MNGQRKIEREESKRGKQKERTVSGTITGKSLTIEGRATFSPLIMPDHVFSHYRGKEGRVFPNQASRHLVSIPSVNSLLNCFRIWNLSLSRRFFPIPTKCFLPFFFSFANGDSSASSPYSSSLSPTPLFSFHYIFSISVITTLLRVHGLAGSRVSNAVFLLFFGGGGISGTFPHQTGRHSASRVLCTNVTPGAAQCTKRSQQIAPF